VPRRSATKKASAAIGLGSHAAVPDIAGLEAARPLTHIEALELDYLPSHLIVLGGGYSASRRPRRSDASAAA